MLHDFGRSWVIACHSREIGNILLYYYHLENVNGGKEKWWPGRDMVWVLVGVRGCVAVDAGHSLVTLLSLSMSVKHRSLHKPSRQVTDLLSWAHTWVWALGRLVALLSWIWLFPDRLIWRRGWWMSSRHTESRTQDVGAWSLSLDGDLDTRDRRVMGWSCLCLGYKQDVCFWGT